MELIKDFQPPDGTRLIWHSSKAKQIWEPRIQKIANAHSERERQTVALGMRNLTLQPISRGFEYERIAEWARNHGLAIMPVRAVGRFDGFAHRYTSGEDMYVTAIATKPEYAEDPEPEKHLGYPQCLPPDSWVWTNKGPRRIAEINNGDSVVGNPCYTTVVDTMSRQYDGELLEITVMGLGKVLMTPDHPVLAAKLERITPWSVPWFQFGQSEYISAKYLSSGTRGSSTDCHRVAVPIVDTQEDVFVDWGTYTPMLLNEDGEYERKELMIGRSANFGKAGRLPALRGRMRIDSLLAELTGWYLSEGYACAKRGTVSFSLNLKELKYAGAIELIAKILGLTVKLHNARTALIVSIYSPQLAKWLIEQCGSGAGEKRIPSWAFIAKQSIVQDMLNAYINGDGHIDKKGRTSIHCVSEELVRGIHQLLIQKLGIVPSAVFSYEPKNKTAFIEGREVNVRTTWSCGWQNDSVITKYNGNLWLKVKKIRSIRYQGPIHNIETLGNNYCVPFVVHNCCQLFFLENFPKYIDPMWQWAGGNEESRRIIIQASPYSNPLLRYWSLRYVSHIPCSPNCVPSIERGQQFETLIPEDEREWLSELLSGKIRWSCLHGVAEIHTEHFRIICPSNPTSRKYEVLCN